MEVFEYLIGVVVKGAIYWYKCLPVFILDFDQLRVGLDVP